MPTNKLLPIALIVIGAAFILLYPMTILLPDSWLWEPRQPEYEQMIIGVYFVLGVFLLLASRAPDKHLSLIWFTAISSAAHGVIMLAQALVDPMEHANLMGDVPALLVVAAVLIVLTPKRLA